MIEFFRLINKPCADMAALISAAQDKRLSRSQRAALRFHLLYCTACRRFSRQVRFLRSSLRFLATQEDPPAGVAEKPAELSPQARTRIEEALRGQ